MIMENCMNGWEYVKEFGFVVVLHPKTGAAFGINYFLGLYYVPVILNSIQVSEMRQFIRQGKARLALAYLRSIELKQVE
jgi:hypothetical protein